MPSSNRHSYLTSPTPPPKSRKRKEINKRTEQILKFLQHRYSNSPYITSLDYDQERKKIIVILNEKNPNLDMLMEQIQSLDRERILVEYTVVR